MLYFFKLLFLLINIDQETVLNWFGITNPNDSNAFSQVRESVYNIKPLNIEGEFSSDISLETLRLIIEGLWEKVQDGLTLADLENILFFILFVRFVILAIRYNLKTSFYITCIGLFAGYLWYRHLIDLISMYRNVLIKLPFFHNLGMDAVQLRSLHRQMLMTEFKAGEDVHWYDLGKLIYYSFTKGIVDVDPETGLRYYIDPISMIMTNLKEPQRSEIVPLYYKVYNSVIPKIYYSCSKFWEELSGIAAYAVVTRIGKRYCPYLIRWHWTFLLIIGLVEHIFIYLMFRMYHFQSFILIPQTQAKYFDPSIFLQIEILNVLTASIVLTHIALILFGMFHAIWGQYFYVPFFVENTELHIGPRPKNSVYSGGNTAWQDEKQKNMDRVLPKLWFGWFGRGTQKNWGITTFLRKFVRKMIKKLKQQFRR
jgi:hypothetical protein